MFYGSESINPLGTLGINARFKGSKGRQPSASVGDTEFAKAFREKYYNWATNAMQGKGFGPDFLQRQTTEGRQKGLNRAYATARTDLTSDLARMIDPSDKRVRGYIMQEFDRQHVGDKERLRQTVEQEKVADKDFGMNLINQYLATEKRMTGASTDISNQAILANANMESQIGTFGTNLAGGMFSGVTDAYFAQRMASN